MQIHPDIGAIFCSLCKHCTEPLRRVQGPSKRPHVTMPGQARANGMWHGPDPPELQELSYAECKVINLARIYVSVKRVSWTGVAMLAPQSLKRRSTTKAMSLRIRRILMRL